jgi:hypothetical protein
MCLGIITALAGICSAKAARNRSTSSAISPEQAAAHLIQAGGVGWGRRGVAKEELAAACAHALRGGGGGGGGGGSLHRYFHRAAQLEEEQNEREHRAAVFECGRHSYVREVLGPGARLERDASLVLATRWLARSPSAGHVSARLKPANSENSQTCKGQYSSVRYGVFPRVVCIGPVTEEHTFGMFTAFRSQQLD